MIARAKANKRAEEICVLINDATAQIEELDDGHRVGLAAIKECHDKQMITKKERQAIEFNNMTCCHSKELEDITEVQCDERNNFIKSHAQVRRIRAEELEALKEELLQLKNKHVSSVNKMYMQYYCCMMLTFSRTNNRQRLAPIFQMNCKQSLTSLRRGMRPAGSKTSSTWEK